MKLIRSYVIRECIFPFFLALAALTCIFLLGNLIQLTNLVINKGVPLPTIGQVFLLYVPMLLGYTLPIACLVGIILGFSRLSTDNEILAMRATGMHLGRLLLPLFVIGVIISMFCIILNERIIPHAHFEQHKMVKNLGTSNPTALIEAGAFIDSFDGQILFIHKIEDTRMQNVTIYQPQPDGPTRIIFAKRGEFAPIPGKDQIQLKLENGTMDKRDADNPDNFYKLNFDEYFMTLDFSKNKKEVTKKPMSMTLKELSNEIERLEQVFVDTSRYEAEYHRKITWSFASLAFIMLGFPMAVITHKREKSANIILAIVCGALYYILSLGCEALSIESFGPAWIMMWIPNALAFSVALFLNYKCGPDCSG